MDSAWFASRYDKGTADYINCPLTQEEYLTFWRELCAAKEAPVHGFEDRNVFEGCMPVEVMARRGGADPVLRPLKALGPPGPQDRAGALRRGAAAPGQRRREHLQLGGLSDPPDLAGTEAGVLPDPRPPAGGVCPLRGDAPEHLFGFPRLLDRYYRVRTEPRIVFAGQITGVEGYVESTASGFVAALELARRLEGKAPIDFPRRPPLGPWPCM